MFSLDKMIKEIMTNRATVLMMPDGNRAVVEWLAKPCVAKVTTRTRVDTYYLERDVDLKRFITEMIFNMPTPVRRRRFNSEPAQCRRVLKEFCSDGTMLRRRQITWTSQSCNVCGAQYSQCMHC